MRSTGVVRAVRGGIAAITLLAAGVPAANADVLSQANELGVSHLTLQTISKVAQRNGTTTTLTVELDGRAVTLEVEPDSVRSDSFTVVLDHGGGVMEEIAPPPSKVVRGEIVGEPGSIVAGTIDGDAVRLMILRGEQSWSVQPVEGEGVGVHAVYSGDAVLDLGGTCSVEAPVRVEAEPPVHAHHMADGVSNRGTGDFRIAEIAIEADWRLYNNNFNRNEANLLNDIDSVLAGVSAAYERDVALTYELTHVLIRTSSGADPYDTNDPSALLGQFQQEWNNNQTGIQRDVAHLWSGRNFSGSTIGIAYLGVICSGSSYGANQILFTGNFNSRVGLFAHELGHNWSAEHCNEQSECRIMCSGLGGCNGLGNPARFAAVPISQISAHIASRTCVDNIGIGLPVSENFNGQTLDPVTWGGVFGFEFINDGSAPSGNRAARFVPPFMVMSTVPIDLSVSPGNGVAVSIAVRPEQATETPFSISAASIGGPNQRIGLISVDGTPGYQPAAVYLPASTLNQETVVRVSADPDGPEWRFDDLEVFEIASSNDVAALPFIEDYERAGLFLDSWQPSDVDVIADSESAESGDYLATMPANGRMETVNLTASGATDIVFGVRVSSPEGAPASDELVMTYRNSSGQWVEARRYTAAAFPSDGFGLAEVVLPADASHNQLRVAIETVGAGGTTPWRFEDFEVGGEARAADCPADLAAPAGVLDLADINAFVGGFTGNQPIADLAEPFGVYDLSDVGAFVASFVAGCP